MARTTGLLALLAEEPRIREIVRSEVINLEATRKSPNFRLEWNEFSGGKGLFTIDIKAPLLEGSNSPLLEATFSGIAVASGDAGDEAVEPTMVYQVQFASDGSFTSNLEIFDLGIRRTAEIKAENISRHAKARARIIPGGSWSEWYVSGSGAVSSGSAFDTTVDDLDDINDGTTHGKVVNTALTSNQPDLSKAGVLNRTQDNIADTATRAAVNPDTLTSNRPDLAKSIQNKVLTNIADDGTFRKTAIAFIDSSNRITTIRKTTGAINVAGDDLFKYTGASAQNLDNVGEGATFGKVNLTALTSNNVDLSKAGVTNKTLQHIADQGTTRQAVTGNEKTGAGRGFSALNSSNRLTTGTTNRTVANIEGVVSATSKVATNAVEEGSLTSGIVAVAKLKTETTNRIFTSDAKRNDVETKEVALRTDLTYADPALFQKSAVREETTAFVAGSNSTTSFVTVDSFVRKLSPGTTKFLCNLFMLVAPNGASVWQGKSRIKIGAQLSAEVTTTNPSTSENADVEVTGLTGDTTVTVELQVQRIIQIGGPPTFTGRFTQTTPVDDDTSHWGT